MCACVCMQFSIIFILGSYCCCVPCLCLPLIFRVVSSSTIELNNFAYMIRFGCVNLLAFVKIWMSSEKNTSRRAFISSPPLSTGCDMFVCVFAEIWTSSSWYRKASLSFYIFFALWWRQPERYERTIHRKNKHRKTLFYLSIPKQFFFLLLLHTSSSRLAFIRTVSLSSDARSRTFKSSDLFNFLVFYNWKSFSSFVLSPALPPPPCHIGRGNCGKTLVSYHTRIHTQTTIIITSVPFTFYVRAFCLRFHFYFYIRK